MRRQKDCSMRILVIGAGNIGRILIKELKVMNHEVSVMDLSGDACEELAKDFDVLVFKGDVTHLDDLQEVRANKFDLIIAVTGDESKNLLGCLLAKDMGVKKVIARVQDPRLTMLASKLGITRTICPEIAAAEKILQIIARDWA
jgi:trk system potassium uptake protein TrkA